MTQKNIEIGIPRIKVLHILRQPIQIPGGTSIRTKHELEVQKKVCDLTVVTSPFFLYTATNNEVPQSPVSNGIQYYNSKKAMYWIPEYFHRYAPLTRLLKKINSFIFYKFVLRTATAVNPDVIFTHSPSQLGNVGLKIAQKLKIPFIYEIRGFIEDARVAKGEISEGGLKYNRLFAKENYLMTKADAVVAINKKLAENIFKRGIDQNKVFIAPNGVSLKQFKPTEKDQNLVNKFQVKNDIILGYIGSVRVIEGLEIAIRSLRYLKNKTKKKIKLIIVGCRDNNYKESLDALADSFNVSENVIILNSITNDQIISYYSLIDIFLLPRTNTKLNNLVSPLKVLEAMGMGKAILASDVGGLKEVISHNITGILFESENEKEFKKHCLDLIENKVLQKTLGNNARDWVQKNRDWDNLSQIYFDSFRFALKSKSSRKPLEFNTKTSSTNNGL